MNDQAHEGRFESLNVAALRYAQAYKALQVGKRLHADMTPARYAQYCLDMFHEEALCLA